MPGTQKGLARATRFVTVSVSEPYEGVGRALASAFSAIDQADLPRDMINMLDQLDQWQFQENRVSARK